jgi:arylsulfatase A-like enzyme
VIDAHSNGSWRRAVAYLLLVLLAAGPAGAAERPNIVLFLSDNLGYGDLGSYGGGAIRMAPTPRLDRLAEQGMRFTNFNVEAECSPSRSALMTGRYAIRSGTLRAAPPGLPNGLAPWEYTIAELLSDAGYDTAMFGKWHLGYEPGRLPNDQGFDQWWGFPFSTDVVLHATSPGFDPSLAPTHRLWEGRKGEPARALEPYTRENRPQIDAIIAEKSVRFIESHAGADRPFFLFVAWSHPHHPVLPHPDFAGRSGNGPFADVIMEHDHRVGEVLDAIEKAGIADDTLVIYASDNGPDMNAWPEVGSSGPYNGYLGNVHEGSIRTPLFVRWPGHVPEGAETNEIVAIHDLYPTLAAVAGADLPDDRGIDGLDQSDLWFGASDRSAREHVIFFWNDTLMAVKWRQFKIHLKGVDLDRTDRRVYDLFAPRVYNVAADPREERDLLASHMWTFRPALEPVIRLLFSLEDHGLIEPGGSERVSWRGKVQVPLLSQSQIDESLSAIKWMFIERKVREYVPFLPGSDPDDASATETEEGSR